MLKVTLHNGPSDQAGFYTVIGRLDIGYEKLDALAAYKVSLWMADMGECANANIANYPRWSGSIWDLVARAICLSLNRKEELTPPAASLRRGAFVEHISAVIEHWPDDEDIRRRTLGTLDIERHLRRCSYVARLNEDILGEASAEPFSFAPKRLTHWDLVSRAIAMALWGDQALGPRPGLILPRTLKHEERECVRVADIVEPARTGLLRWMFEHGQKPVATEEVPMGLVSWLQYKRFLGSAV